jgi:hypothetical protein
MTDEERKARRKAAHETYRAARDAAGKQYKVSCAEYEREYRRAIDEATHTHEVTLAGLVSQEERREQAVARRRDTLSSRMYTALSTYTLDGDVTRLNAACAEARAEYELACEAAGETR